MKEGTPVLQNLSGFNQILRDLLALEMQLEEDNALLLFSSLSLSYDHLSYMKMGP